MKSLVCPKCKSEDSISQIDVVTAYARIAGVFDDGSIEWDGETEIDWNNQRPAHDPPQFMCEDCSEIFTAKQLGIVLE